MPHCLQVVRNVHPSHPASLRLEVISRFKRWGKRSTSQSPNLRLQRQSTSSPPPLSSQPLVHEPQDWLQETSADCVQGRGARSDQQRPPIRSCGAFLHPTGCNELETIQVETSPPSATCSHGSVESQPENDGTHDSARPQEAPQRHCAGRVREK